LDFEGYVAPRFRADDTVAEVTEFLFPFLLTLGLRMMPGCSAWGEALGSASESSPAAPPPEARGTDRPGNNHPPEFVMLSVPLLGFLGKNILCTAVSFVYKMWLVGDRIFEAISW